MLTFVSSSPSFSLTAQLPSSASSPFCARSPLSISSFTAQCLPRATRCSLHAVSMTSTSSSTPSTAATPSSAPASAVDTPVIMVNGLPGKMALSSAEEAVRRGLTLTEAVMTGAGQETSVAVSDDAVVRLEAPDAHEETLRAMKEKHGARLIVVDYTHPSCANSNVALYCRYGIPFVIGTTGGDASAMRSAIDATPGLHAVIAPNMGKQIVAFQTMMTMMADQFPSVFAGYTLSVKESHQANKADTSGTARSVVQSFKRMGIEPFEESDINLVRDADTSINEMKVPSEFVTAGHAFHTYQLKSPDGSVTFEFQHNVCGRNVYACGTVDAVLFLDERIRNSGDDPSGQRIFSMIDILQSGTMS